MDLEVFERVQDAFQGCGPGRQLDPLVVGEPGAPRAVRGGSFGSPLAHATLRDDGWRSDCRGVRLRRSP